MIAVQTNIKILDLNSVLFSFFILHFQAAPGPLSQAEEEQKAIKEAEARTEVTLNSVVIE